MARDEWCSHRMCAQPAFFVFSGFTNSEDRPGCSGGRDSRKCYNVQWVCGGEGGRGGGWVIGSCGECDVMEGDGRGAEQSTA